MVVLLLAAVLTGVLISVSVFWAFNLKNTFSRWKLNFQRNRNEKKRRSLDSLTREAENFFLGGRLDKALSITEKVLGTEPENIDALSLNGKILCAQGEKVAAAALQKRALGLDPQNISLLFDLAKTYSEAGQSQDEINLLKKIHRDNPKALQPLIHLRNAYLKNEDWKNILTAQDKILPLIRDNKEEWEEELKNKSRFLYAQGKKQWEQGKHDPAISGLKQALKTWNKNLQAHQFLGNAYMETGKPKMAYKKWLTGFEQTQSIACLTQAQKVCTETGGNPKDLIEIYQKAIGSNQPPEKHKYVHLLAVLFLEHNQPDKAKTILEENQSEQELLGSLLLLHASQTSNGGFNFNLLRDAVFGEAVGHNPATSP